MKLPLPGCPPCEVMTDGLSLVPVVVFYFFFFFLILSFVVFYFSSLFSQKGFFGMKYNKIKRKKGKKGRTWEEG